MPSTCGQSRPESSETRCLTNDRYTARRLRIWLMRKSGKRGTGYRQYPDSVLYQRLGLIRLRDVRTDLLNAKV